MDDNIMDKNMDNNEKALGAIINRLKNEIEAEKAGHIEETGLFAKQIEYLNKKYRELSESKLGRIQTAYWGIRKFRRNG